MAGLCGAIDDCRAVDALAGGLDWAGHEDHFGRDGDRVAIRCALPANARRSPPLSVGAADVWIWGNVHGVRGPDGYRSLPQPEMTGAGWADLYDRYGPSLFARINGDFFAVVHDRDRGTVSFVTDRLGTRDCYYRHAPGESLVFSSRIQTMRHHPAVDPTFDDAGLCEYLTARRAFGTTTPLTGVSQFQPGSITTYDLRTRGLRSEYYWRPRYRPADRPFSAVVDLFVDRYRRAVADRAPPDERGALLLSGGADSRLLLAVLRSLDRDVTAYHMAGWRNREARIAERVARTAGVDFHLLRRDERFFERLLDRTPPKNNFVQRFHQAVPEAFTHRLRRDHDYVMTNHFPDVLFDFPVPRHRLSIGPLGPVEVPIEKSIETIEGFVDYRLLVGGSAPPYLGDDVDPRSVITGQVERTDVGAVSHGVTYESFQDMVLYGRTWPGTNGTDTFLRRSIGENVVHRMPMLDARILDLWPTVPKRYLLRRDLIAAAIRRIAPELAAIPHAGTGVPPARGDLARYPHRLFVKTTRSLAGGDEEPPRPTLNHGPWGNLPAAIRHEDFLIDAIEANQHVFEGLPMLDYDGAIACYEDHVDGANHARELATLATFLEMPLTQEVVAELA